ncbi:vomeronasal type-2 receptor 26-like [Pelobates cultripes]|uniref:Vomeronasal type-2 receptor 26-like n=1 Tax=Pelobates cultripes TaxID=61616 RepID=A0AAD1SD71_PELCU|nr:vomeronasal type-2 receptor 26-like [Pelobates cultripes]
MAVDSVIKILSGFHKTVPNYSCREHGKLAGVIGDLQSSTTLQIANILGIYGYTQISYGATHPVLTNKLFYPSFFQTLQNDKVQYQAIVKLLKHFGWTWIGVIAAEDDSGDSQSRELERLADTNNICIEFILKIKPKQSDTKLKLAGKNKQIFKKSTSTIVVICGSVSMESIHMIKHESGEMLKKTLIIPASWPVHLYPNEYNILSPTLNGSLVFILPSKNIPKMRHFFENRNLIDYPDDSLLEDVWAFYFKCQTSIIEWNWIIESFYKYTLYNCSRETRMNELESHLFTTESLGTPYHIYKSVYALAHALNDMEVSYFRSPNKAKIQNYNHKLQELSNLRDHILSQPVIGTLGKSVISLRLHSQPPRYSQNVGDLMFGDIVYYARGYGQIAHFKDGYFSPTVHQHYSKCGNREGTLPILVLAKPEVTQRTDFINMRITRSDATDLPDIIYNIPKHQVTHVLTISWWLTMLGDKY